MYRRIAWGIVLVIGISGLAGSQPLTVDWSGSGNHTTIQAAITAAGGGDEIIVGPGTYTENINFNGKAITVRSGNIVTFANGNPTTTIINGGGSGPVVSFWNNEGLGSVLKGFTITNGQTNYGGGITCDGASPTITNCIITQNAAVFSGGGIDLYNMSNADISDCKILNNDAPVGGGINIEEDCMPVISSCEINDNNTNLQAGDFGGGLSCVNSDPVIMNCFIAGNEVNGTNAASVGGAIYLFNSDVFIVNCTIVENSDVFAGYGGIYCDYQGDYPPTIKNCIIMNNGQMVAGNIVDGFDVFNCEGDVSYSYVESGTGGVHIITGDPGVITAGRSYYLLHDDPGTQLVDSPCINAGDPSDTFASLGLTDPAGYTTSSIHTADSDRLDIGYHRIVSLPVPQFVLTTAVTTPPPGPIPGSGAITPVSGLTYNQYEVVGLGAIPANPLNDRVFAWIGTDDDTIKGTLNTVMITANQTVQVQFEQIPTFTLTVTKTGIGGTIDIRALHNNNPYKDGTVVPLVATVSAGYITIWTGTDNDNSLSSTNAVTMNSNRVVTVRFREPISYNVPGQFTTIGAALNANDPGTGARLLQNGDEIIVDPGIYHETGLDFQGRALTIASQHPDSPENVEATVIDGFWNNRYHGRIFVMQSGEGRDSVINGLTIINGYEDTFHLYGPGRINPTADPNYLPSIGGGIACITDPVLGPASPTLVNCVFRDCTVRGVDGRDGADGEVRYDGQDIHPGDTWPAWDEWDEWDDWDDAPDGIDGSDGDNGYGRDPNLLIIPDPNGMDGWGRDPHSPHGTDPFDGQNGNDGRDAFGGAMFFGRGSSPVIRNCQVYDSHAIGGNGGAGGDGIDGQPGRDGQVGRDGQPGGAEIAAFPIDMNVLFGLINPINYSNLADMINTLDDPNDLFNLIDPADLAAIADPSGNFYVSDLVPLIVLLDPVDLEDIFDRSGLEDLVAPSDLDNSVPAGDGGAGGRGGHGGFGGNAGYGGNTGDGGAAAGGGIFFDPGCNPIIEDLVVDGCTTQEGLGNIGGNAGVGGAGGNGGEGGEGANGGGENASDGDDGDGGDGGRGGIGGIGGDGSGARYHWYIDPVDGQIVHVPSSMISDMTGNGAFSLGAGIFFDFGGNIIASGFIINNNATLAVASFAYHGGTGGNGGVGGSGGDGGGDDGDDGSNADGGDGGDGGHGGNSGDDQFYGDGGDAGDGGSSGQNASNGAGGDGGDGDNDGSRGEGSPDGQDGINYINPHFVSTVRDGGGCYYGFSCVVDHIDCTFTNNISLGHGGGEYYSFGCNLTAHNSHYEANTSADPFSNPRGTTTLNSGGGIYFAGNNNTRFTESNFVGNNALDGGGIYYNFGSVIDIADCNFIGNNATVYDSRGGGIEFGRLLGSNPQENVRATIVNSTFSGNTADYGAGLYWYGSATATQITDCTFVGNTAQHGGGMYWSENGPWIKDCTITGNNAIGRGITQNGINLYGGGAGFFCWSSDAVIEDTVITDNIANGSGGGVYFGGDTGFPWLKNCLIVRNSAVLDGGGIAARWYATPTITNCTIADNEVTLPNGAGGGISSSYGSDVIVRDSIVWGNTGVEGSQLAAISGSDYYQYPSTIDVKYSDIQPVPEVAVIEGPTALDIVFVIDTTGSMGGLLDAMKISMTDIINEISLAAPDFRVAIVDYRDFGDVYVFNDDISFSTDIVAIQAAIDGLAPAGGGDWAEAVLEATMHSIEGDSLGGWRMSNDVSRAIILMSDAPPHYAGDGANYLLTSEDVVTAANAKGITIFSILTGPNIAMITPDFTAISSGTGGVVHAAADSSEVSAAVLAAISQIDLVDSGLTYPTIENGSAIFGWDSTNNLWDAGRNNLDVDPNFIGEYFLSHVAAGQLYDSPCIDAGDPNTTHLTNDPNYTTRTDSVIDFRDPSTFLLADPNLFVAVDMGYHHPGFDPDDYTLDFTVIYDSNELPEFTTVGTPDDPNHLYVQYTQVVLNVTPPPAGYEIVWRNTDNDSASGISNVVTMDSNKVVTARYQKISYRLTIEIIGDGTVDVVPDFEFSGYLPGTNFGYGDYLPGTQVELFADPNTANGYRVRRWYGTNNDPNWGDSHNTVTMTSNRHVTVVFELDVQYNLLVPEVYATIEEAVAAANRGDNIVLAPIEYYISDPDGIDFEGKNLTIMSTDPDEPAIIAETVINCQGSRFVAKRAFHFHNGEDNRSKIWGITIKNGYISSARGADGALPGTIWPGEIPPNYEDNPVTRAPYGVSASGDGYGGAILCENESSPTFENVVFYNNTVTGAQGGDGTDGWPFDDPPYNGQNDAQPGGHGGDGQGNGYGGAVACLQRSSPVIINCTFEDNTARGGMGGNGGDAGPTGGDNGHEAPGGNGGDAIGFGQGGGVYFDSGCLPIITGCTFVNNNAISGLPGSGGTMTEGNPWGAGPSGFNWVAHDGTDGVITSYESVRGGALYYGTNCDADVTDCNFVGNRAFESSQGNVSSYVNTRGGAIFSDPNNTIVLKDCDFVENLGGAVYAHSRCRVDVDNCTFVDNANPVDNTNLGVMSPEAPAGALYLGPNPESHQIDITDCDFRGNSTSANGGAVVCKADASLTNCSFGGNTANGYGGAFYGYKNPDPNETTIFLDFRNCSFMENEAVYGGGLYIKKFVATFNNCYFMANEAGSGGGLFLSDGTIALDGGIMRGNRVVSDFALGGAMACAATAATIENFVIEDNVVEGTEAYGGGIMFYGGDELITHTVKNCLFKGNRSSYGGGAIGCNIFVTAEIDNCTFDDNDADMFGGALFCDWSSHPEINNSIFTRNGHHAVYEEEIGGDSQITFSLFNDNPDGDLYDAETGVSYTGAAAINTVNANGDNIDDDPLFAVGTLGDHYLAIASPAVDWGSALSVDLGLNLRTTRIDNAHDDGTVDLGYHYADIATLQEFQLIASVIGGHGSVTPTSGTYYSGQAVTITAIPDASYFVKAWGGGTLNDNSKELTNVVIMGAGRHGADTVKHITVQFAQPRILVVGTQAEYTSIQRAIDEADDGDIVMIMTGTYAAPVALDGLDLWGKDITITGLNPDDPIVVAETVLFDYDFVLTNVGPRTIIEGITIQGAHMRMYSSSPTIRNCNFIDSNWRGLDGVDGPSVPPDIDGGDGVSLLGGAVAMYDSSPEFLNCTFDNCSVTGGSGGRGDNGNPGHVYGWDGGWAGRAYGGAVYAAWKSDPNFTDCTFNDCFAQGGNGGDGGDGFQGAHGGRGGNWVWSDSIEASPYWYWWDGWMLTPLFHGDMLGDYGWFYWYGWYDIYDEWYLNFVFDPYDRYYDYWEYSGYGGAFFAEVDCNPKFNGCTFTNNRSYGGVCGIGGDGIPTPTPVRNMDIDTAGGAVFISDRSHAEFFGCMIANNFSDTSTVDLPDNVYVSYGGGVACEKDSALTLVDCEIQGNEACLGGGIYWVDSDAIIEDCNVVGNVAYHGGGMYSSNSTGEITGTFFTNNAASVALTMEIGTDPNSGASGTRFAHSVFGRGGGYCILSSLVDITDSVFKENNALASGGGIFYVGSDQDNAATPILKNSLIVNNTAGRDGGGISINWFADPNITNCTISDNMVTGAIGAGFGYGGGIYVGYNGGAYISDSIIWGNAGANGAQIAVTNTGEYGPRPSEVTIVYSDIGPPYDPNAFEALLLLADGGQGNGAQTTSAGDSTSVLVDGQTIYDGFDAGQETVRVIILLRDFTDMRAATDWDSAVSAGLIREAIVDRQAAVLITLTPAQFTLMYRYENIVGFAGDITLDGLEQLLDNPMVEHIEPDREVFPMLAQAIPLANALAARQAYNGTGISIAIVDTGIDYTHQRLGGGGFPNNKVIGGYDFGMNDPDPMPITSAHGTACAGIAAGDLGTVGDYIGGVAYGAKLYALKMAYDFGGLSIAAGIASWDWCVTNKNSDPQNPIMVVSNSWGFYGLPFNNAAAADAFVPALTAAGNALTQAGITILAASGNDGFAGQGISHPSAMTNVISVGAVYDTTDMVTGYSNTADLLDILAPADPMYTTDMVGLAGYDPGDYFPYFNGTSSSTPFAAGCVASIQAAALDKTDRYLTPREIRNLLIATGVPVTDTKVAITKPRVNLGAAIANLSSVPIYVDEGCILRGWDSNNQEWDVDTFNIMDDPLLVGEYFLSEPDAGQLERSPCVDYIYNVEQGRMAIDFGLEPYTTRSDSKKFDEGIYDENALDLGYHRLPFEMEVKRYSLDYFVIVDPFMLPDFDPVITQDPEGPIYNQLTQIRLTVEPPPPGYHSVWTGADDDLRHEPNNIVTMDGDRIVIVEFESIGYTLEATVVIDANILPGFEAEFIELNPLGIEVETGGKTMFVYEPGTVVEMTVTPPPEGFQVKWTDADDGTTVDATNIVTMTSNKKVIATYVEAGTEYYAVLVGISDYYDPFFQFIEFPYASRDARELRARLVEGLDWDEDNIYTLTDSQATKGAIRLVLQQLSEKLDSDDVLVFYFSGYGLADVDIDPIDEIDGQDEYLITYEYDRIRDDELGQMLAEFATDNYVVLIESDFSAGQIDGIYSSSIGTYELPESVQFQFTNSIASENGLSFSGDEDVDPLPQDLNRNEAGVVLTACGVDEIAFYSADFRHGVFTYYLLRAIEGGADWLGDNSGYVSAEEAYDYLAPKVDAYILDMVDIGNLPPGTTQGPRIYDADDESDIDILNVDPPGGEPTTWYVPGDADRIQDAVDNARDGDVIVLTAGTYKDGVIIIDKAVTITGTNPDDPDVVAGTVIDLSGTNSRFAVYFTANAGPGAVLNGITITADGWSLTAYGGSNGFDGGDIYSTGIIIGSGASPTIKNCVISGFTIRGGRGGDGDDDESNYFNGNGGNGGNAYGGGVYCLAESSPTFINTTITDCHVFGGDGGDGAEVNEYNFGGGRGGWGGWARGGGVFVGELAEPLFINCTISDCTATGGNGGNGGDGGEVDDIPYPPGYGGSWSDGFYYPWQLLGYEGGYTLYSAYGGGVYCSVGSNARFVDCTISGNSTQGGVSGLGGEVGDGVGRGITSGGRIYPFEIYEIPSFGGGIYCAPDSIIEFEGGEISSNVAPKPGTTLVIDPALGYGGGIVLDDTANAEFKDCLISGNEASIGGGVYWYGNGNALLVEDCNIMDNLAYNGGGIYGLRGDAVIDGGVVHGNFAGATETDPEQVVGRGGGINLASVTVHIRNLELFNNQANASGGGLYLGGTEPQISTINNCLFANNKAGRDGGGISSNWFAELMLSNCTFVNNWATGYFGFLDPGTEPNEIPQEGDEPDFAALGGGLYCGYESNVDVIDSIFNGNYAPNGRQLAVGTGFEFDPRPGSLDVSYSNVQGGQGEPAVLVEEGCEPYFNWSNNILTDPMFVVGPLGGFYLSQIVAGQDDDSPCVNSGSKSASEAGMNKYTTRSDDAFETYDVGVVDMGFHYPLKLTMAACKVCDLVFDGIVDMKDMTTFALAWLDQCTEPEWCGGADINTDGGVNASDLLIFAMCWLAEDTLAPGETERDGGPPAAKWDMAPQSVGLGIGTIEMSAKVVFDMWFGDHVQYQFEHIADPNYLSNWRQNYDPTDSATYVANPEFYEDTGLDADGETDYTYRVRVRDGRGNMTDWSIEKSSVAGNELDPPLPNPAEWEIMPYAISGTALRMVAYIGTDASPFDDGSLEYLFTYTDAAGTGPGAGDGYSSGWQQSHDPAALYYTATPHIFEPGTGGLAPLTPLANYYYRVSVRDRFLTPTAESVLPPALGIPDPAVVDFNPPTSDPNPLVPGPPLWSVTPQKWVYTIGGSTTYWNYMSVDPVTDPEGNGEEYYFECTDDDFYSSGWLYDNPLPPNLSLDPSGAPVAANWYWVQVPQLSSFSYRVQARDQSPNQNTSGWSTEQEVLP